VTILDEYLEVQAHAKINLSLSVFGKRPDGYHDIESIMQRLKLADTLELKRGRKITLSCPDSNLPEDRNNLVFRAAELFLESAPLYGKSVDSGVDIVLRKRIPIAAGLGGGSSDAAAVLVGMDRLFDTELPRQALLKMAAEIGSDVPFFVSGRSAALATGRGERLQNAEPLGECHILLVNPGFAVSTRWVYENYALTSRGNQYNVAPEKYGGALEQISGERKIFNDLEAVTVKRFPEIGLIKKKMSRDGALAVLMSGSGPTVFGLFDELHLAQESYKKFVVEYNGSVFLTKPY
jgi:4-diphosphocytidyl-2-C-methyl-D-erythritol kinase